MDILVFTTAYVLFQKKSLRSFELFILMTGSIVIVIDLIFLLFPVQFLSYFNSYLQKEMIALYQFNLGIQRYNLYQTTEIFFPFFFFMFFSSYQSHRFIRWLGILISLLIIQVLAWSSGFRTRLVQSFSALFFSSAALFVRVANKERKIHLLVFASLVIIPLLLTFFVWGRNSNILQRLMLTNREEDIETIQYRISSFSKSIELMKTSPFIGIGLGNYKSYINQNKLFGIRNSLSKIHTAETLDNPHSMISELISETGILGFGSFLILIILFIYQDIVIFTKQSHYFISSCIISSWVIFIYGIFNPFNTFFLNGWFWFFRGILESNYFKKDQFS